jgi:hypothetical protein
MSPTTTQCHAPWPSSSLCFGHGIPLTLNTSDVVLTENERLTLMNNGGGGCVCRCLGYWRSEGDLVSGYCHIYSPLVWALWCAMGLVVCYELFLCIRSLISYWRHLSSMHHHMRPLVGNTNAKGTTSKLTANGNNGMHKGAGGVAAAVEASIVSHDPAAAAAAAVNNKVTTPVNDNPSGGAATFTRGIAAVTPVGMSPSPKHGPRSGNQHLGTSPHRAVVAGASPVGPSPLPDHGHAHGNIPLPPPALAITPTAAVTVGVNNNNAGSVATVASARIPSMWSLPQVRFLVLALFFGCGYASLVITKIWSLYTPYNIAHDLPPTLAYWFGATLFSLCVSVHSWRIIVVSESIASDHSLSAPLAALKRTLIIGLTINFLSFILLIVPIYVNNKRTDDDDASNNRYVTDVVQEACIMGHLFIKILSIGCLGPVVHRRHANQILKLLGDTTITTNVRTPKHASTNGTTPTTPSNGKGKSATTAAATNNDQLTAAQLQRRELITSLSAISGQATKGGIFQIILLSIVALWPWFRLMGAYVVPIMLSQGTYVVLLSVRVLPKPSSAIREDAPHAPPAGAGNGSIPIGSSSGHHRNGRGGGSGMQSGLRSESSHTHDTHASQIANRVVPLRQLTMGTSDATVATTTATAGTDNVAIVGSSVGPHLVVAHHDALRHGGRSPSPLPGATTNSSHDSDATTINNNNINDDSNGTAAPRLRLSGVSHRSYSPVDGVTTTPNLTINSSGSNGTGANVTALSLLHGTNNHLGVSNGSGQLPTIATAASLPSPLSGKGSSHNHQRIGSGDRKRDGIALPSSSSPTTTPLIGALQIGGSPPAHLRIFNSFSAAGANPSSDDDTEADLASTPVIGAAHRGSTARNMTTAALRSRGISNDGFVMDMNTPMHLYTAHTPVPTSIGIVSDNITSTSSAITITTANEINQPLLTSNSGNSSNSNGHTSVPSSPSFVPLSSRNRLVVGQPTTSVRTSTAAESHHPLHSLNGNGDLTNPYQQVASPIPGSVGD